MGCSAIALRPILKTIQLHQAFANVCRPGYPPDFRTALFSAPARKRRKNPRNVTMPEHVGPRVKLVFAKMARQRITYDSLEERSGVRRATTRAWRRKSRPGLERLEAALATLGFGLVCPLARSASCGTNRPRAQTANEHPPDIGRTDRHRHCAEATPHARRRTRCCAG